MKLLFSLFFIIRSVCSEYLNFNSFKPNFFMFSREAVSIERGDKYRDVTFESDRYSFNVYPALFNAVYKDYKFETTPEPMIDVENIVPVLLKGSKKDVKYKFKREDFDIYFNFRNDPEYGCFESKGKGTPVTTRIKEAIEYAKLAIPSYHVIGTCASFGSDKNAKRPQTYTLSYRDVKLGEYEILAKEDSEDKLNEECDLTSLYKYMPDTPHFTELKKTREPTIPDEVRSNTVENGIQKIKFSDKAKTMFTPTPEVEWEDEKMTIIVQKPVKAKPVKT